MKKEKLLVSACLLGIPCRYDGASKPKTESFEKLGTLYEIIPVCPEIYGGLPTPRTPSERVGNRVIMKDGSDVTENYRRGAQSTLDIAKALGARLALLKEKSPSCGKGKIYDGTFTGSLKDGNGTAVDLLLSEGIRVYGESEIDALIKRE